MAGRPKTNVMLARIDALGADSLLARIASGESLKAVSESIGVSRQVLSGFLNSEQNRDGLRAAREQAAHVFAEEALAISDAAKPQDVQVAKLRVDTRRWLASKLDRAFYGDDQRASVTVNIGQLHLDALRKTACKTECSPDTECLDVPYSETPCRIQGNGELT